MSLKLYQTQVLAGAILVALVEGALALGGVLANSLMETVEGAGFIFCCLGCAAGARGVRTSFVALGSDKTVAKRDPVFMSARAEVQMTALVAMAAVGLVAARRFNIPPTMPIAGTTLFGLGLPLINRATGWSGPP
jgi:hypothetical protein